MDGIGIAAISVGTIFIWGGIKGYSPLKAAENIIQGKHPNENQTTSQLADTSTFTSNTGGIFGAIAAVPDENAWITGLLNGLGAPTTPANINSISGWINHEGPFGTQGRNNPLNTTQNEPGATSFSGLAVKNYPNAQEGIDATVTTLQNGSYNDILMALRSGQGLCGRSFTGLSTWSGKGYSEVCLCLVYWMISSAYAHILVISLYGI